MKAVWDGRCCFGLRQYRLKLIIKQCLWKKLCRCFCRNLINFQRNSDEIWKQMKRCGCRNTDVGDLFQILDLLQMYCFFTCTGPLLTRFKVYCFELILCDVALVRSAVCEEFSASVSDQFQPTIVNELSCYWFVVVISVWKASNGQGDSCWPHVRLFLFNSNLYG